MTDADFVGVQVVFRKVCRNQAVSVFSQFLN
jgi:hypothetical protein